MEWVLGVLFLLNHKAWTCWSPALPPGFLKVGDSGLMSQSKGQWKADGLRGHLGCLWMASHPWPGESEGLA